MMYRLKKYINIISIIFIAILLISGCTKNNEFISSDIESLKDTELPINSKEVDEGRVNEQTQKIYSDDDLGFKNQNAEIKNILPSLVTSDFVDNPNKIQSKSIKDIKFTVDVSSIFDENIGGETTIYSPQYISDDDIKTAWVEGSKSDGVNEWVLFKSQESFDLNTIQIMNGYTKSESIYNKNNKIAEMKIIASSGEEKTISLDDRKMEFQEFHINFKNITSIKLLVTKVYKGTHYNDLCISEIRFNNQLLDIELSEDSISMINQIKENIKNSSELKKYIGCYRIAYNGGFYDKDFKLVEKFDESSWEVQCSEAFALLENGLVSGNLGAATFYSGSWKVEDNMVVIDRGREIRKYYYKDGILYGQIDDNTRETYELYYNFITNNTDQIVYEGLTQSPLGAEDYPLDN